MDIEKGYIIKMYVIHSFAVQKGNNIIFIRWNSDMKWFLKEQEKH